MIEKSSDMEKRYEGGIDTWGNRERRLYQKIFKAAVESVRDLLPAGHILWYDVGCGGGNIWDTVLENSTLTHQFIVAGCDLSSRAVEDLRDRYVGKYPEGTIQRVDLEEYDATFHILEGIQDATVVSIVDVAYYFGEKRPWKDTMDQLWRSITPGTYVIVADSLIPYQRRSYFGTKEDCELIKDYTDYTVPVSTETRDDGSQWHRYFKVKIYRKLGGQ